VSDPNKASITLQTKNEPGKLSDVLLVIKKHNLNLTKIQSVPIPTNPNSYSFHLDIEFSDKAVFDNAIKDLHNETTHIKILGLYRGEKYKVSGLDDIKIHKNLN
jgi:prephenate dehydratase